MLGQAGTRGLPWDRSELGHMEQELDGKQAQEWRTQLAGVHIQKKVGMMEG